MNNYNKNIGWSYYICNSYNDYISGTTIISLQTIVKKMLVDYIIFIILIKREQWIKKIGFDLKCNNISQSFYYWQYNNNYINKIAIMSLQVIITKILANHTILIILTKKRYRSYDIIGKVSIFVIQYLQTFIIYFYYTD